MTLPVRAVVSSRALTKGDLSSGKRHDLLQKRSGGRVEMSDGVKS